MNEEDEAFNEIERQAKQRKESVKAAINKDKPMNNPPAFPLHNHGAQTLGLHVTGMTLQDYFAAKAMQGLIARESSGAFNFEACPNDPWRVAQWAYDVADQMLKAREA